MRFKRSYGGFQQANEYLDILEEKLRKAYRDYMNKGVIPTPSLLKSELLPSSDSDDKEAKVKYADRKYEYQVNISATDLLLGQYPQKILDYLTKTFAQNIEPIRSNRSFVRKSD